jgi:signal transduction histidine kinase
MLFQRIYVGLTVKLHFLKKFIFIAIFFLLLATLKGQDPAAINRLYTDSVKGFGLIEKNSFLFIDSTGKMPIEKIATASFTPLLQFTKRNKIPSDLLSQTFYLRFSIQNNSTEKKSYYYYPGKLYKKLNLFKISNGGPITEVATGGIYDGFVPIEIDPKQTNDFIIQLVFFKTSFNEIESKLIGKAHIQLFKNELFQSMTHKKTTGIILSGMLLMMILVTLLNYFISKKIEFLYNSFYSLCMFLLIFLTSFLTMNPSWFKGLFISYLDLLLLIMGTLSYLAFTRHFLNTKELHPKLNRFLKLESRVIAILMILFTIVFFGFDFYLYEIYLENIMKILLLIAALVYIFLSFTEKNPLMNYLAVGAATQIFFSTISFVFVITNSDANQIYTSPIFYFELGVVCSVIFFLLGLFYKNSQELISRIKEQEAMKLEVEKQSFENQLTVYKTQQEERNRISADMHDDLGAGMTTIRLYSELAKSKAGNEIMPEIEKISSSADEVINKMNAIIWSMSSQNDSLGNMVAYIRSYSIDYLENTGVKPIMNLPDHLPELVVNGTIRRNVFLVMKEALQNIVKHSNASEVIITMNKESDGFSLSIHDNGEGINFENIRPFSNGLTNMRKRMADVNIDFSIENKNGTLIKLYKKTR